MGHGQLVKLLTLAVAVVAPAAAAAGRQLQEGTAGTCISITEVSGRPFQRGQDAESLQVGAWKVCEPGYIVVGVRSHWSERTTMMVVYFDAFWDVDGGNNSPDSRLEENKYHEEGSRRNAQLARSKRYLRLFVF